MILVGQFYVEAWLSGISISAARLILFANRPGPGDNAAMPLPVVAIVGRPNVGKSSLLNRLAGRRIAIVAPTPGVTRDRISAPCEVGQGYVDLVDTGGMGIEDVDNLTGHVEAQIAYAVKEASLIEERWLRSCRYSTEPESSALLSMKSTPAMERDSLFHA